MKKWLLIAVVILGLLFTSAYVFFPKEVNSSNISRFNCNINGVNIHLFNENQWAKWWPGTIKHGSVSGQNIFDYNGYQYSISEKKYNALVIQTNGNGLSIEGAIFFVPIGIDSVRAEWKYSLATNSNPVNKIHLYLETKKINNNMIVILNSMKNFLDNKDNIYGLHIDEAIVKDTILITTNFSSSEYPTTDTIYSFINGIKSYIAAHNALETNYPMLNVKKDSGLYKTQLAIPINKEITGNETYPIKRMVPGKILVSQVTGGVYTANEAIQQIKNYMSDYQLSSPAIPFESLVTNRMQETDTSKWITKIYYPVF